MLAESISSVSWSRQEFSGLDSGPFNCRFLVSYFSQVLIFQISRSRVTFHATSAILHPKINKFLR